MRSSILYAVPLLEINGLFFVSIDLIFIGNSICFHTGNNSSLLFMSCKRQVYVSMSSIYSITIHHVKRSLTSFYSRHHLGPQNILKKNFCVINHHHVVFLYYHSVSLHYKKTRIYSLRQQASLLFIVYLLRNPLSANLFLDYDCALYLN